MKLFTDIINYQDINHSGSQHHLRQELAKHTIVSP